MTRRDLPRVIAGVLAVALLASLSLPQAPADDPEVLRMRSAMLAARAEAAGWKTTMVDATDGLERQIVNARDSLGILQREKAAMARDILALGARLQVFVDMYAEARGQIEAQATEHRVSATALPDSVTARLDDGLLVGRVTYLPAPRRFDLDYVARMAVVLGAAVAPDGRLLLTARGTDPRVELEYGSVFFQPPASTQVCTIGERAQWGAGGGVLGLVLGLVAR